MGLEIVWRNPHSPEPRLLRVVQVTDSASEEETIGVVFYFTILASGWPENEYQLLVKRNPQPAAAQAREIEGHRALARTIRSVF